MTTIANNTTINENTIDLIRAAELELRTLGVIVDEDLPNDYLRINRHRLSQLGLCLVLNNNHEIYFIQMVEFNFTQDRTLYINDVIPRTSLQTYTILCIRNEKFS
jgi:hypothetical protein